MNKVLNKLNSIVNTLLELKAYKYVLIPLLLAVMFIWWFLEGTVLIGNSTYVCSNSEKVLADETAVKVLSVSNNSTLRLENTESIESSSIENYIRTAMGIDTYYLEGKMLSVSVTLIDSINMCYGYLLVELAFIMVILFLLKRKFFLLKHRNTYLIYIMCSLYSALVRLYYVLIFKYCLSPVKLGVLAVFLVLVGILEWAYLIRKTLRALDEGIM